MNSTSISDAMDGLYKAAKKNPEGLLLLAAGVALLLRHGVASGARAEPRTTTRSRPQSSNGARSSNGQGQQARKQGLASTAGDYLSEAGDFAGEMTDQVTSAAKEYAGAAAEYASQATQAASQRATQFARQTQSTLEGSLGWVMKEQPLAIGIAGLAAGAALAAAFPPTELEKQTFGPAAEAVADVASQTSQQFKDAAAKVGDALKAEVDERGLNTDGLKEVAKEAAATFSASLSGRDNSDRDAGSSAKAMGSSASDGKKAQGAQEQRSPSARSESGGTGNKGGSV